MSPLSLFGISRTEPLKKKSKLNEFHGEFFFLLPSTHFFISKKSSLKAQTHYTMRRTRRCTFRCTSPPSLFDAHMLNFRVYSFRYYTEDVKIHLFCLSSRLDSLKVSSVHQVCSKLPLRSGCFNSFL